MDSSVLLLLTLQCGFLYSCFLFSLPPNSFHHVRADRFLLSFSNASFFLYIYGDVSLITVTLERRPFVWCINTLQRISQFFLIRSLLKTVFFSFSLRETISRRLMKNSQYLYQRISSTFGGTKTLFIIFLTSNNSMANNSTPEDFYSSISPSLNDSIGH